VRLDTGEVVDIAALIRPVLRAGRRAVSEWSRPVGLRAPKFASTSGDAHILAVSLIKVELDVQSFGHPTTDEIDDVVTRIIVLAISCRALLTSLARLRWRP
jgi:hypothetical protein